MSASRCIDALESLVFEIVDDHVNDGVTGAIIGTVVLSYAPAGKD